VSAALVVFCCLDCPEEFEYETEWLAHGRDSEHELLPDPVRSQPE
jgi:hypothetical protein